MRDLPDGLIFTLLPRKISLPKHIVPPTVKLHSSLPFRLTAGFVLVDSCVRVCRTTSFLFSLPWFHPHTCYCYLLAKLSTTHQWHVTQPYPGLLVPLKLWTCPSHKAEAVGGVPSILATYSKEASTSTWVILGSSLPSTCLPAHLCWSLIDTSLPEEKLETDDR